jgi:hypothetical protein
MKNLLIVLGFCLFAVGFLSLILTLVGLQFGFLMWIENWGPLMGLIIRLIMIFGGMVLLYLARTDWNARP